MSLLMSLVKRKVMRKVMEWVERPWAAPKRDAVVTLKLFNFLE